MAEEKIDFEKEEQQAEEKEMSPTDFKGGTYLKNKPVGEVLTFEVIKILQNKVTTGTNKTTQKVFNIGLTDRHNNTKRYDIYTPDGVYTVSSWEIYFKILAQDGLLMKYAAEHKNSFTGAKVSIKRNFNGGHATTPIADLMKILDCDQPKAETYQAEIKEAIKNKSLFEVSVA